MQPVRAYEAIVISAECAMGRASYTLIFAPCLLPDHHLGGLDDDRDPVTRLDAESLERPVATSVHHAASLDLDLDLAHDGARLDASALAFELIACAEFHVDSS